MSIAGHVSRAMLERYSHVRMEAKRRAPDGIDTRQREADEKRKKESEQKQEEVAAVAPRAGGKMKSSGNARCTKTSASAESGVY
jgi:hypothetical protein